MKTITDTDMEYAIRARFEGYRSDPIGFMTDILGVRSEHIWSKMRDVAESLRDNHYTAVPACHSVSKTYGAGRLAVWFKTCFQPSTVITTAPSDTLVKEQLWREIKAAYAGALVPLGGKMHVLKWDMVPHKTTLAQIDPSERVQWEKNFAIGFSTNPDSVTEHVTKMQGFHNKYVLIILDEAGGLMSQIWQTALQSLMIDENCYILAIGNATDPYGDFADACVSDLWNTVRISVRDTPNYKARQTIIPGVAGYDFERRIISQYGENSNEHKVRCLGEFPTFAEGAVWGVELGRVEREKHIGDYPWDPTAPVYTFGDYGNIYTSIGFFQFIGPTIRMIDYFYDDKGIGIPGICKMFDSKPYNYAKSYGHWGGPDLHPVHGSNRKSLATGRTLISEFSKVGYVMNVCEKHSFDAGIKVSRDVWPLMRIDDRCIDFVDSIRQYKFKKNVKYSREGAPAYSNDPEPTPSRHPADMFRHLSWVYRFQLEVKGQKIGYPYPSPVRNDLPKDVWGGNILDFGRRNSRIWN